MTEATLPTGYRIDKYQVLELLGRGGMGEVYLAEHSFTRRHVVVKVIRAAQAADPEMRERLRREAMAGAAVSHPNIVVIHDGGITDDGMVFIVMEHLVGKTLRELVMQAAPFDLRVALSFGWEIARAIAALHAIRPPILHRDLKPENVFVLKGGAIKLIDFGLARIRNEAARTTVKPIDGGDAKIFGTLAYMAPEQLAGRGPATEKVDVYALGLILWEMLTGHHVFQVEPGVSPARDQLIANHLFAPPRRLVDVRVDAPEPLTRLVAATLAKQPEERPTAALVAEALAHLIGERKRTGSDRPVVAAKVAAPAPAQAPSPARVAPASPAAAAPGPRQVGPRGTVLVPIVGSAPAPVAQAAAQQETNRFASAAEMAELARAREHRQSQPDAQRGSDPKPAPPAGPAVPRLVVVKGTQPGTVFPLKLPSVVIGRENDVDVALIHGSVSRHHARIDRLDDGNFRITDLNSVNGLDRNRERIKTALLEHGDQLTVGDVELAFYVGPVEPHVAAAQGAAPAATPVHSGSASPELAGNASAAPPTATRVRRRPAPGEPGSIVPMWVQAIIAGMIGLGVVTLVYLVILPKLGIHPGGAPEPKATPPTASATSSPSGARTP